MSTWFDDNQRPCPADETHPMDLIEPVDLPDERGGGLIALIDIVGDSYTRGNTEIIRAAWKFLLNKEPRSMRDVAKKLGCSAQAISQRVRRLSEKYCYPIPDRRIREMKRMSTPKPNENRKRRGATRPPAAADEQLQTNDLPTEDSRPSTYGRGVNESTGFSTN